VRGLKTVLVKECRDNLRDRRTILSSFSLALLGPAVFIGLMTFVLNTTIGESDDPVEVTIVGADHAPNLVSHLATQNTITTYLETDDPRNEITSRRHDLVLVIGEDFQERFSEGQIIPLTLWHDSSKIGSSRRHFSQMRGMIRDYARTIGLLRLQLRGVEPSVANPIIVQEMDTASPAARALTVLATLPYLLVLVVFMGGFYLAIDATAGEREHGSLEPLLCQPISRTQLVLGKILSASLFSAMSLILFLVSLAVAIPFAPLHKIGMSLDITLAAGAAIFLVTIPLMIFGAAVLTAVASFAKSYKEAQTYLTIVVLVPTLPLILTQLMNIEPSTALMMVPSLSQSMLIGQLIIGESLNYLHLAVSVAMTGVAAALMVRIAIWLYSRERILI
jgi:sodium transport system permease protein